MVFLIILFIILNIVQTTNVLITNTNDPSFYPINITSEDIMKYLDDTVFSAMYQFNVMNGKTGMDFAHFIRAENEWVFEIIFDTIKCKPKLNESNISNECKEIIKKMSKMNEAQWEIFDETCHILGLYGSEADSECVLWKFMKQNFIRTPDELRIVFLHDSRSTIDGLRETDYCTSWKCSFRTFLGEILIDDVYFGQNHIAATSTHKYLMFEMKPIPLSMATNWQSVIANRYYHPKERYVELAMLGIRDYLYDDEYKIFGWQSDNVEHLKMVHYIVKNQNHIKELMKIIYWEFYQKIADRYGYDLNLSEAVFLGSTYPHNMKMYPTEFRFKRTKDVVENYYDS